MQAQIREFEDHDLQKIMALFLLNPKLFNEHKLNREKQTYFFHCFRQFAKDYYHFVDNDASIYFGSVYKYRAGEWNSCGGMGKVSNSTKTYFKSKHNESESKRVESINHFSRKYRINIEPGQDERLFLGVREIWNKLDQALDIVMNSKYADIASQSYSDETLTKDIPQKLDKLLIPLSIRNRVWQKHLHSKRTPTVFREVKDYEEEEEEGEKEDAAKPISTITFVPPPELFEEEW